VDGEVWTDTMAPFNNNRPREYWAFRLGRLMAQLPRLIEQAYFYDSYRLQTPSIGEPPIHVRDQFPSIDWVIAEVRKTLVGLGIEDAPIPKYDKRYGYQLLCTINYEEVS
jgi:hypothetical protein